MNLISIKTISPYNLKCNTTKNVNNAEIYETFEMK